MPKIIVKNLYEKVISFSNNNEAKRSVLAIIHENNIDWRHACGGKGNCTTCKFKVVEGEKKIMEPTGAEQKFLNAGRLGARERLACQAVPLDSIEIEVPKNCKLPHIDYSF